MWDLSPEIESRVVVALVRWIVNLTKLPRKLKQLVSGKWSGNATTVCDLLPVKNSNVIQTNFLLNTACYQLATIEELETSVIKHKWIILMNHLYIPSLSFLCNTKKSLWLGVEGGCPAKLEKSCPFFWSHGNSGFYDYYSVKPSDGFSRLAYLAMESYILTKYKPCML